MKKEDERLLEFLVERISTMYAFITSDEFGPTSKLNKLEAMLGACRTRSLALKQREDDAND